MKLRQIYDGKAKTLFEGPEPGTFVQYFKDSFTAFNGIKKAEMRGKGIINNLISEQIMLSLHEMGITTHFIKRISAREQLIRAVEIIPLEVIVRNFAAGSIVKRLGLVEGTRLPRSIVEYCLKDDKLGDPMVADEHITAFNWASPQELDDILSLALRINDYLSGMFWAIGIRLVDLKLEFGRIYDETGEVRVVLADEISPDSCRLWDKVSNEKLDKDRFRLDLGNVMESYQEIAKRMGILIDMNLANSPSESEISNEN